MSQLEALYKEIAHHTEWVIDLQLTIASKTASPMEIESAECTLIEVETTLANLNQAIDAFKALETENLQLRSRIAHLKTFAQFPSSLLAPARVEDDDTERIVPLDDETVRRIQRNQLSGDGE